MVGNSWKNGIVRVEGRRFALCGAMAMANRSRCVAPSSHNIDVIASSAWTIAARAPCINLKTFSFPPFLLCTSHTHFLYPPCDPPENIATQHRLIPPLC